MVPSDAWGGEGIGTCSLYTDMWSVCAFVCWLYYARVGPRHKLMYSGWSTQRENLKSREAILLYYNHPESSGGQLFQKIPLLAALISVVESLFPIFSLVCMCDFYSYFFIIFSQSFFKCIISLHVLNICVSWLRVSHSADSEATELSVSESCKWHWNTVL